MIELLHKLTDIDGISGDEQQVAQFIKNKINDYCDSVTTDSMGNIIAFKKGKLTPNKKVMFSAHMDEVGFIITYLDDNGYGKFSTVGGIDSAVLPSKPVRIANTDIKGTIATVPVHLTDADARTKAIKTENMNLDFMGQDVKIGDYVAFDREFTHLGGDIVSAKAIDDRIGCAMLINLIHTELEFDCYFVFTVCEEIGARGAVTSTYSVEPDVAFVIESTTAADIPTSEDEEQVCKIGNGPVLSFMDKGAIYDRGLFDMAIGLCKDADIKCQTKNMVAGGNDSQAVTVSKKGVKTLAISLPTRYLHSPSCAISMGDVENTEKLLKLLADNLGAI